jgi:NifU-like protein involved in Fe-S cluster formation
MSDDLYAKELLRWAADASRAGHLPEPKRAATVNNAMCGDKVTMEFAVDPTHEIYDCRHETKACVLTQASASILAAHASGESADTPRPANGPPTEFSPPCATTKAATPACSCRSRRRRRR